MILLPNRKAVANACCTILLFAGIFSASLSRAQTPVHQQLYWTRISLQSMVIPKWQVNAELENRRFFYPDYQQQSLFQTQTLYKFREGILAGAGLSLSWVFTTTKSGTLIVPETSTYFTQALKPNSPALVG